MQAAVSVWHNDEDWEEHVLSARDSFGYSKSFMRKLLEILQVPGEDNPADVGTKCVQEKDMAVSMKRLGMSHAMRMTTSRNALPVHNSWDKLNKYTSSAWVPPPRRGAKNE